MRILADTNILARLAQPSHHLHPIAQKSIESLLNREDDLCIVPQVIYEFWVVATRPASSNGLDMTAMQAQSEIAKAKEVFSLMLDERAIFEQWERLVRDHKVKGKSAHDARLVAAMHRHELTHILTFNPQDFARYPGINVLSPTQISESA